MHQPLSTTFATAYRQLTPVERTFVDGVMEELERLAHYNNEHLSAALYRDIPPTIVRRSQGMLERALVRAAIAERIYHVAADQELSGARITKELMAIAYSSMGHYMTVDEDGNPMFDLARCTPEQLSAIKTIEVEGALGDGLSKARKQRFKIVLHDKLTAIKTAMQHTGMLEPDNPQWRATSPRAAPQIPEGSTPEQASELYAGMIE